MFPKISVSIKNKLLAVFIALITIPMLTVGLFSLISSKGILMDVETKKLNIIADLKAKNITDFFDNIKRDMAVAQDYWNIKTNLPLISAYLNDKSDPKYIAAKKALDSQFISFQERQQYLDFMLLNRQGKVVYATNPKHFLNKPGDFLPEPLSAVVDQAKREIIISDIILYEPEEKKYEIVVAGPAYDNNGRFIGIILFEIDMVSIYDMVQDTTGLGKTGETLIVKKQENRVIFLNPLRHDKDAALKRETFFGSSIAFPAQLAVSGKNDMGISVDYRGKQVLAVWRYIPILGWGMVVKIDTEEAFSTITRLRNVMLLFLISALMVGIFVALLISKSISEPVRALHEGVRIIGQRNLDYKVGTKNKDEIGELSRAFDQMTADLKKTMASRDELNKEIEERKRAEDIVHKLNLELENRVLERTAQLQESVKEIENFSYSVSHNLRAPLRAMDGFAHFLEERYRDTLDPEGRRLIDVISNQSNYMGQLIDGLLTFIRLGRQEMQNSEIDMTATAQSVYSDLLLQEKGRKIEFRLNPLPSIQGDSSMVRQMWVNLLSNAVKFTRKKEASEIEVGTLKEGKEIVYYIKDNGVGFDMKYADKLFGVFEHLSGNNELEGTGVGLALVQRIVHRHGGRIWAESKINEGSTFKFTLQGIKEKSTY